MRHNPRNKLEHFFCQTFPSKDPTYCSTDCGTQNILRDRVLHKGVAAIVMYRQKYEPMWAKYNELLWEICVSHTTTSNTSYYFQQGEANHPNQPDKPTLTPCSTPTPSLPNYDHSRVTFSYQWRPHHQGRCHHWLHHFHQAPLEGCNHSSCSLQWYCQVSAWG